MKCSSLYRARRIGQDYFLVSGGDAIEINEIGRDIWNMLKEQKQIHEIAQVIAQDYQIDETTASADIIAFVDSLTSLGVISE